MNQPLIDQAELRILKCCDRKWLRLHEHVTSAHVLWCKLSLHEPACDLLSQLCNQELINVSVLDLCWLASGCMLRLAALCRVYQMCWHGFAAKLTVCFLGCCLQHSLINTQRRAPRPSMNTEWTVITRSSCWRDAKCWHEFLLDGFDNCLEFCLFIYLFCFFVSFHLSTLCDGF